MFVFPRKISLILMISLLFVVATACSDDKSDDNGGSSPLNERGLLAISVIENEPPAAQVFMMNQDGSDSRAITRNGLYVALGWTADGNRLIVAQLDPDGGEGSLHTVKPDGSDRQQLLDSEEVVGLNPLNPVPAWSPDGKKLLFTTYNETDDTDCSEQVFVADADGANLVQMGQECSRGNYLGDSLMWSPDGSMIGYQIETPRSTRIIVKQAVENGVEIFNVNARTLQFSADGTRVLFDAALDLRDSSFVNQVIFVQALNADEPTPLTDGTTDDTNPVWSPDEGKIAFVRAASEEERYSNEQIFVMNTDGTDLHQITALGQDYGQPTWSPDGTQIAVNGEGNIYLANADGSNLREVMSADAPMDYGQPTWSPDSTKLAFVGEAEDESQTLFVVDIASGDVQEVKLEGTAIFPLWQPAAP